MSDTGADPGDVCSCLMSPSPWPHDSELPSTPVMMRSEVHGSGDAIPNPGSQLGEHPGLEFLSLTSPCLTLKLVNTHLWSTYCILSTYGVLALYLAFVELLALSVGAGKEEKVRIFREETSLRGKTLEDDTERIAGHKRSCQTTATQCVFGSNRQHPTLHPGHLLLRTR